MLETRTMLRFLVLGFAIYIAMMFLWVARAMFITAFLGVLVGLALSSAADWLERHKVKRSIGAPLVLLVLIGLLAGLGALMAPKLRDQTRELGREAPKVFDSIDRWFTTSPAAAIINGGGGAGGGQPRGKQQQKVSTRDIIAKEFRGMAKFLFPIISSAAGAIGGLVIVLFLGLYIAIAPDLYRAGILHLVPHEGRAKAANALDTVGDVLRSWLVARLLAMVAIGFITGIGLLILKVKAAVALAVLAALLEFIPFFGPILAAIPALGMAFVDSPQKALWVVVLYIFVQQIEGNVITPLLLKKKLDIPPALTIIAVSALGIVFGVLGMLVAEPLLAVALVLIKMLYVRDVVGDRVPVRGASA